MLRWRASFVLLCIGTALLVFQKNVSTFEVDGIVHPEDKAARGPIDYSLIKCQDILCNERIFVENDEFLIQCFKAQCHTMIPGISYKIKKILDKRHIRVVRESNHNIIHSFRANNTNTTPREQEMSTMPYSRTFIQTNEITLSQTSGFTWEQSHHNGTTQDRTKTDQNNIGQSNRTENNQSDQNGSKKSDQTEYHESDQNGSTQVESDTNATSEGSSWRFGAKASIEVGFKLFGASSKAKFETSVSHSKSNSNSRSNSNTNESSKIQTNGNSNSTANESSKLQTYSKSSSSTYENTRSKLLSLRNSISNTEISTAGKQRSNSDSTTVTQSTEIKIEVPPQKVVVGRYSIIEVQYNFYEYITEHEYLIEAVIDENVEQSSGAVMKEFRRAKDNVLFQCLAYNINNNSSTHSLRSYVNTIPFFRRHCDSSISEDLFQFKHIDGKWVVTDLKISEKVKSFGFQIHLGENVQL